MDGSSSLIGNKPARALLTALLALLLCGLFAGAAQAIPTDDPFDGTNFQAGDGDQLAEDGHRDWQSIAGDVVGATDLDALGEDPSGFTGGSKESDPGEWVLSDNDSPPKDDILNAWATTEIVNGHRILYMAFVRKSPNGNTFLTFELNQRTNTWNNGSSEIPCREHGDTLISYEVEPGGTTEPDPVTIHLYLWQETGEDAATGCSTTGTFQDLGVLNDAIGQMGAQGSINEDGPIQNFLDTNGDGAFNGDDVQEFGEETFGEAAIDVSAVFGGIGSPCFDFGQIQLHSRASSEISSELKDFVGPLREPVGGCVIEVDKKIRNVTLGGTFVDTPPDIDAYVGDTLEYQFTVTNPGAIGLAVAIEDPLCDATPTRTRRDGDDELLDPDEVWVYVCSHVVTAADPDPLPNTVTATGTVPGTDHKVTGKDSAEADILHPAIDIEKTGPATATVGAVLSYTLTVTNPGDIQFAADKVVVTDPRCDAAPTLTSTNGDASPGFLDPRDTWTYACSHLTTAADGGSVVNTATVTGTDRNGRQVSDADVVPTALGQVLPQPQIVSGAARLRGPSGCVKGPFTATVRGSRIARVTFFVDGKRLKRVTAPNGEGSRFTVSINPRGRGFGVHRVTARVEFAAASADSGADAEAQLPALQEGDREAALHRMTHGRQARHRAGTRSTSPAGRHVGNDWL